MILMIWYNLYYIDIDKSCRLVKGLRIHICNHSKNFSMRGWPKVAAQFLSNLGIQRIGEDHLRPRSDLLVLPGQAWPSAGFSPGLLSLQVSWWTIFCLILDGFCHFLFREKGEDCLVCFLEIFWSFGFSLFLNVGSTPKVSVCISLLWPVWIGLLRIEIGELSFFLVRKKSRWALIVGGDSIGTVCRGAVMICLYRLQMDENTFAILQPWNW